MSKPSALLQFHVRIVLYPGLSLVSAQSAHSYSVSFNHLSLLLVVFLHFHHLLLRWKHPHPRLINGPELNRREKSFQSDVRRNVNKISSESHFAMPITISYIGLPFSVHYSNVIFSSV
jgi:hypothetical protein